MIYDDVVVGSGLAALGTVLGLAEKRSVLVIAGPSPGSYLHYDASGSVPCAYLGDGGLGTAWHGVIPLALDDVLAPNARELTEFLARFYPFAAAKTCLEEPELFVPWRPIRPPAMFDSLTRIRPGRLERVPGMVTRFSEHSSGFTVESGEDRYVGRRLWIAAGTLHTPGLLDRSLGMRLGRGLVSDHALCYVGQIDGTDAPSIRYSRDGMFIPFRLDDSRTALYTLRPARFAFRRLDFGIEQRAAFGLPTGGAIAKVFRAMSAGLFAEALYNRFGILAAAARHSIYAQVEVPDAYSLSGDPDVALEARTAAIMARTEAARGGAPFPGMVPSQRNDLYIQGIHLHHSVDTTALASAGLNLPGSNLRIVDASVMERIGPAHHSFRMMLAAWRAARDST